MSTKRSRSRYENGDEESKAVLFPTSKMDVDRNQGLAIKDLKKRISQIEKQEAGARKYIDVGQTLTPGNTFTIAQLTPIAQGDGDQNRDGDKVAARSLELRMTLIPNATSTSDTARIMVVHWKGNLLGNPPGASTILESTTNVDSPNAWDYRDQYTVLYDQKLDLSLVNGNKHILLKKGLKNKVVNFNGVNASDYTSGQIFLFMLCTDNTNKASINYYSRVRFIA